MAEVLARQGRQKAHHGRLGGGSGAGRATSKPSASACARKVCGTPSVPAKAPSSTAAQAWAALVRRFRSLVLSVWSAWIFARLSLRSSRRAAMTPRVDLTRMKLE